MTISKTELVKQVSEKVGSVPNLYNIIGAVFECVAENLVNDNEVVIKGFGKFKVVNKAERIGRNPQTGEEITIPAHKTPVFSAGKTLRQAVN